MPRRNADGKSRRATASAARPGLSDRRTFARFTAKALLLLLLLLLPWTGMGSWFVATVLAVANPLLAVLIQEPASLALAPEGSASSWNALLTIELNGVPAQRVVWELRRAPYLPMAAFAALCLAYPASGLDRRVLVMGLGLGLLPLLSLLRLIAFLGDPGPLQLVQMPTAVHAALTVATRALVLPPGMAYAVPALLFVALLACFDRTALGLGKPLASPDTR
jgi:hypothetical protein